MAAAGITDSNKKYLQLLAEKYPSVRAVTREIININAILNLPKGTEHFMSDLHGEYEAFCHILNNCSGVIREKVELLYRDTLPPEEIMEICTLIYYPAEKLRLLKKERAIDAGWYRVTLERMLEIARVLSSKYTRSKVRKAMPEDYAYIIDELLHAQKDEDNNQVHYHNAILDTVISLTADDFVIALADLMKRLAVDRLHIVGDIFDRGDSADKILDLLMTYHAIDIEWGNHDILWMGAAAGSEVCIACAIYNCLHYNAVRTLESGYGISLRGLTLFAQQLYPDRSPMQAALAAITVLQFKLEGQLIRRNPDFGMDDRMLLHRVDFYNAAITLGGVTYPLNETQFPTVSRDDPYALTPAEREVMDELRFAFLQSAKLQRHIQFIYDKGGMYRVCNGNLLYHGCVPLDKNGGFQQVTFFGTTCSGKAFFDLADEHARAAFFSRHKKQADLDFMWYLRCGESSPLNGRKTKGFENAYLRNSAVRHEEKNPYYRFYYQEAVCERILAEFGLHSKLSHIINGHTPVRTVKGELPIRAGGRLLVIDGGFCKNYHAKTGIAGYTLIFNSHGLRLKAHQPFESREKALRDNRDIHSSSEIVETEQRRVMVYATDAGDALEAELADLALLLELYRTGKLTPCAPLEKD